MTLANTGGKQSNTGNGAKPWIVLKYGGTSVSGAQCWDRIAARIRQLRPGCRVWITASALSQVSNHLEQAITESLRGEESAAFDWIAARHREFAEELELDESGFGPVAELLEDLAGLLRGIRLTREAPPRLRARVMSFGELASSRLGGRALALRGIDATWLDARTLLTSTDEISAAESTRFLEATVRTDGESSPLEAAAGDSPVILTQGFIAGRRRARPACSGGAEATLPPHCSPPCFTRIGWRSGPTCAACSPPTREESRRRG